MLSKVNSGDGKLNVLFEVQIVVLKGGRNLSFNQKENVDTMHFYLCVFGVGRTLNLLLDGQKWACKI